MKTKYILLTMIGDPESHVIAQLMSETDDDILLGNPLVVRAHYDIQKGAVRTWVKELVHFTKDGVVQLAKNAIATIASPSDALIETFKTYQTREAQIEFARLEGNMLALVKTDEPIPEPTSAIKH